MGECYAARRSLSQSQRSDRICRLSHQGAYRWVDAVNADGTYGKWAYAVARKPEEVGARVGGVAETLSGGITGRQ